MKQLLPLLHCLALMLGLATLLAPARAGAQVLHGTFAAGITHSLSIHADGTLWATGDNEYGQLGLPTSTASSAGWVQVGTATNWVQVAACQYHSLGLRTDGSLWAWGNNHYGQLGNATNNDTDEANPTPTRVAGTYTQVATGSYHSLGLRADGTLYAWGVNSEGQLGSTTNNGLENANPVPTQVGTDRYTQVAAGGFHSLGLRADGSLWAWGFNNNGQLGVLANSATDKPTPTPTQVAGTYTQVAAGDAHSLGLRADGTLFAWGYNYSGQLGNATNSGTTKASPTPTQVGTDLYTQLAAGNNHSLGLRADGSLWAWGANRYGQLANTTNNGTSRPTPTPTQVPGTYAQVVTGHSHSLALRADGALLAWGFNGNGELGNATNLGTNNPNPTPAATGSALPTRSTAGGTDFGLAVRADGTLWAWGGNGYGQFGDGTTTGSRIPRQVGTAHDWVMVAAGLFHGLGLKADGTLWAWGYNNYGQLGSTANNGTIKPNPTPTQVAGTYTLIAAGNFHSLGRRPDGTLWVWGDNSSGQLGQGFRSTTSYLPTPTQVGTATYTQLAGGQNHSLARRADGTLWAWGGNSAGQLGTPVNTTVNTATPLQVGTATYTQVAAGSAFSLGLRPDGTLWAWGINTYGQLGNTSKNGLNNTGADNPTPAQVAGTYTQVAAGQSHSLGLRPDGTLWVWGQNTYGQLGTATNNGSTAANPTPTQEATRSAAWATLAPSGAGAWSLARTASGLNFASTGYNGNGQLGDGTTTQANRFDRLSPLASLQPLPVQLVRFEARRSGLATVALSWATASEVNNAGFGLEKSADGRAWQQLAFVPGAGSSSTAHTYAYLDADGAPAAYYRLAQADLGGAVHYSPVQYVGGTEAALSLYPNPASSPSAVLHGAHPGAAVQVLDALGRPVLTTTADTSGTARLSGLAPGIYLVRSGSSTLRLSVE